MFNSGYKEYDKEVAKQKRKLRNAWEKFYSPLQLSQAKFRIKVNSRIRKGKFPSK
jgi:hypothetical protein